MTDLVVADTLDVAPTITAELFGGFNGNAAREAARAAAPALYDTYTSHVANSGKTGIKAMTYKVKDQRLISPFALTVEDGWNSRDMNDPENLAHIERLALSIKEEGVREPLKVRYDGGKLHIRNGHCRYFAVMLLMVKYGHFVESVPVITVNEDDDEIDDLFLQATTNDTKPLTSLEFGILIQKLTRRGVNNQEIAKRMARSVAWVEDKLRLLGARSETKELVRTGAVSPTLVSQVVRDLGPTEAKAVVEKAVENAAAEGRSKVTKRDVDAVTGRRSPAKTLAALRDAVKPREDDGAETVVVNKAWLARVQAQIALLDA